MDGLQVNTSSVTNGLNTAHASGAGEGPRPPPTPTDLANIPILSRTRVLPAEVEEAEVVLSLGEYQNLPAISNPEAKLLLGKLLEKRQQDAESAGGRFITTDTLNKTMDYLDAFARFRTETGITDVDKLLSNYPGRFEFFEKAQLGTLCPTDSDEAFTLIPSLKAKFDASEMDDICHQLTNLKAFEST